MKILLSTVIMLLLLCQKVLAVSPGTILYIPLDNRPVCLDYTVATMQAAGWDIKVPPREYLATQKRDAAPEELFAWLEANASQASAVVASADALIYGGLVASRVHNIAYDQLQERAERLINLKSAYPGPDIYVFSTIMRSPRRSGPPVEPDYYEQWGEKIFRLGELGDRLELGQIKRRERRELKALKENIPQEIIADAQGRRKGNIEITELLLHGVESGDFDYMLIGRDDTAPFSQAHKEARDMDILVHELPKERIRFFSGADQLGLVLLSRASTRRRYELPLVYATYAAGAGGETLPAYEDDLVSESVKQHVLAAGGFPTSLRKNADLVLAVNTPADGVTLDATDAKNTFLTDRQTEAFLGKVTRLLQHGHRLALADVKFGNGADNALVAGIFARGIAYELAAYSGWNTAGNSIGFALAQGILSEGYADGIKEKLLTQRYLDDWAYQANVRNKTYKELIWPRYWPNQGYDQEQLRAIRAFISKEIDRLAQQYTDIDCGLWQYSLPWERMFEIKVEEKNEK